MSDQKKEVNMALIKWKNRDPYDPWSDIRTLQEEINDLFDIDRFPPISGLFDRSNSPSIDIVEGENDFTVACELPGLEQKDIDLSIVSNVLTIKGDKKNERETRNGKYYKKETWSGSFQRTLSLPSSVDPERVNAQLKDGILTVSLPKKEEAKPKQISVNVR
jgi:HSP20 family protein